MYERRVRFSTAPTQVLLAAFTESDALPLPVMSCGGDLVLPVYACAVLSFFVVAFVGCASACARAGHLARRGLLDKSLTRAYFFDPAMRLARILFLCSCWLCLCAGLFLWGATGNAVAVALFTLGPACATCAQFALRNWIHNECAFLVWPPLPPSQSQKDETVNEQELAFGMLQSIMGLRHKRVPRLKAQSARASALGEFVRFWNETDKTVCGDFCCWGKGQRDHGRLSRDSRALRYCQRGTKGTL